MSSPELHIKDSYYFELPKLLWQSARKTKADFPSVWIKNDAQFQAWEADRLCERLTKAALPPSVHETVSREIDRLERMTSSSPEYQMVRTYLDLLVDLPWAEPAQDAIDIADASGAEGKRFHLVGHDWGGQVAWGVAEAHPKRLRSG